MSDDAARVQAEREYPQAARQYGKFMALHAREAFVAGAAWQAAQPVVVGRVVAPHSGTESSRAYAEGRWCGECRYGVVEDPPCCAQPVVVTAEQAWGEGYAEGHDDGIHDAYGRTPNPYRITVEPTP